MSESIDKFQKLTVSIMAKLVQVETKQRKQSFDDIYAEIRQLCAMGQDAERSAQLYKARLEILNDDK